MLNTMIEVENIYKDYYPKLIRFFTSKVNGEYAEDLTQEVFIKVSSNLSAFRHESKVSTWIYSIARNTAIDFLRKKTSSDDSNPLTDPRNDSGGWDNLEDTNPWTGKKPYSTFERIEKKEMKDCYLAQIENMPEQYRDVYILKELEGYSDKEIADILNISLENTKIRIHRARAKLHETLRNHCSVYYNERGELMAEQKMVN